MIGILGLQGDIAEHAHALGRLGRQSKTIKHPGDISGIKGLILPGGESTAISKLLLSSSLVSPIKDLINRGIPVWGTCAGVILLSRGGILESANVEVERNAYGSQLDSFVTKAKIAGINREISMVFIRAPKILEG